jgi:hypothetical protein
MGGPKPELARSPEGVVSLCLQSKLLTIHARSGVATPSRFLAGFLRADFSTIPVLALLILAMRKSGQDQRQYRSPCGADLILDCLWR